MIISASLRYPDFSDFSLFSDEAFVSRVCLISGVESTPSVVSHCLMLLQRGESRKAVYQHLLMGHSMCRSEFQDLIDKLESSSDQRFIEMAYQVILGRMPDAQGEGYYLRRIERYGDRGGVIVDLLKSQEFQLRQSKYASMRATSRYLLRRFDPFRKLDFRRLVMLLLSNGDSFVDKAFRCIYGRLPDKVELAKFSHQRFGVFRRFLFIDYLIKCAPLNRCKVSFVARCVVSFFRPVSFLL